MKKLILALTACMMLLPLTGLAKVYKTGEVPMVHLKDSTKYVCNPDKILSPSTVETIDTMLYSLERATGIEVVVMALSDIDGGDCYQFAMDIAEKYGVGKKKKDNGLIVLLCTEQRRIQILTGYGLEGILPDAICKRIQERHMNPHFAKGEWNKGMLEGMKAIRSRLEGYTETDDEGNKAGSSILDALGSIVLLFGSFAGFIGVIVLLCCRPKRCPQCKKRALKQISSTLVFRENGKQRHHVVYKCKECGHTEERDVDSTYGSNGGVGGIRSSGGRARRSSGGSFGGGRFGGGGAGSKF